MKTGSLGRCVSLAVAAPAIGAPVELAFTHPETVRELHSYGEERRDLLTLMAPFLAAQGFSDGPAGRDINVFGEATTFLGADGDLIGVRGRFNCIVVTYYSTFQHDPGRTRSLDVALSAFNRALDAFLSSLPSPKLQSRTLDWSAPACVNAT